MSARATALAILALALAGCASSHLQVSIDLYDEDPRFVAPLSPEDAVQLMTDVESLHQAAIDRTSQRQYLAQASRDLFVNTWQQAGGSPAEITRTNKEYDAFIAATSQALTDLEPKLTDALKTVKDYTESYKTAYGAAAQDFKECERLRIAGQYQNTTAPIPDKCYPSEFKKRVERLDQEWILRRLPVSLRTEEATVRAAVQNAADAYDTFSKPTATVRAGVAAHSTGAFVIDWIGLRARLNLAVEAAQLSGQRVRERAVILAIQSFNTGMASLAATTRLIPKDQIAALVTQNSQRGPAGLLDATVKIGLELESLRADLPQSASAETALAGLARNSSQFTELIDRLQDAGDPSWRIVTNPGNEEHWNPLPNSAEFYAEGKSSVVFVRNDPMRFDIHDATNNPTALIKGQLEISRAVANAAISVASASAGLPAPKGATGSAKPSDGTTPTTPTTTPDTTTDPATDFAQRKAAADEAQRLRDREIRGLNLELAAIAASLSTGGDTVTDAQKNRLSSVLTAYKAIFETPTN